MQPSLGETGHGVGDFFIFFRTWKWKVKNMKKVSVKNFYKCHIFQQSENFYKCQIFQQSENFYKVEIFFKNKSEFFYKVQNFGICENFYKSWDELTDWLTD